MRKQKSVERFYVLYRDERTRETLRVSRIAFRSRWRIVKVALRDFSWDSKAADELRREERKKVAI